MGFFRDCLGGDKEHHADGSTTSRFSGGESVVTNADGSIRESTHKTTDLPLGLGDKVTVTNDGDGNVINVQRGWGDTD